MFAPFVVTMAWGSGLIIVLAVSTSRLYIQTYYPTDSAAGIALGMGWIMALYTLRVPQTPYSALCGE